jgi:hypothetical protein
MRCEVLAQAATGLAVLVLPSLVAAQTSPPMACGYTNVIPIPVGIDEKATQDAVRRADAFMAAHMPSK